MIKLSFNFPKIFATGIKYIFFLYLRVCAFQIEGEEYMM